MTENAGVEGASVPTVSREASSAAMVLIDSTELALRLSVPESWVRNRTRERTPAAERIPCTRLGRYVRFDWNSARLQTWIGRQCR
jgi:hypothetical protein